MKETGLMFKAPLVRSILDGTKTQTRRLVKPAPAPDQVLQLITPPSGTPYARSNERIDSQNLRRIRWDCQAGGPGDCIYVRETWQGPLLEEFESDADSDWMSPSRIHQYQNPAHCQYAADGGPAPEFMTADDDLVRRWRPAIHMPKWAARIWLDITGVRLERLQDISEADLAAEGIQETIDSGEDHDGTPRDAFRQLWESTGGDWAANPWVWVINFKRDQNHKATP